MGTAATLRLLRRLLRGSYRAARAVAASTPQRLGVFAILALVAAWPLLSTAAQFNEFRDAHVLAHYESAARESLLRWHQVPLWDPYYCGGMYLLGTPQARFVSPSFLLTLLFGETRGEALTVFAMIVLGLEGTYRYARRRGATGFGALLAAPVFALGGIFATSPSLGWVSFLGFELLPWLALGVRRALAGERSGVALTAVSAAWCVGFGGTYTTPLAVVWCAFEGVAWALPRVRRRPREVAAGVGVAAAAVVLAMGLAAVRLWPIAETLAQAPRIVGGGPSNSLITLTRMFFFPIRAESDDGEFYVGFFVVPAVLLGIVRRRSLPLGICAVLYAWLAAGYGASPSLFGALRELPFYSALRYPERFLVLLGLAVAVLAACGISRMEALVRTKRARARRRRRALATAALVLASLALVVGVGPLMAQHSLHARGRQLGVLPAPTAEAELFHQARGNRWALAYYEPHSRGSLSCWEAYPVPESRLLRGDLKSEEYLLEEDAGSVRQEAWSPNAIDLEVTLTRPATVAVNQNWHSGWYSNVGEVGSKDGLLTVALPEGTHALKLRFSPRSATGGALASLVAAAVAAWLLFQARKAPLVSGARDRVVIALLALSPAIAALATAATVRGRGAPPVPLQTPDGRPIVADGIDEGAIRIDARFADGVTLEAATLSRSEPRAGSDMTLELDWQRGAKLEPGLGVFVHIEPSSGSTLNGDHVLLSGVLDFQDAPPGATLRDVIPLYVPDDGRGKTWKVWVGLWRVRREGGRVTVVDAGHAMLENDRVLAASFVAR
jgi:hypothetical protein